ncbi:MAG: TMEM175 family protein [Candidatus Nitrosocosmicus sp.]|nr:TMEM175 family protein [Candidatus Nitrosocosmicus sp.]
MTNFYGIQKLHLKLFVDAVFGIAITLLAVELQIPQLITSFDNDLSDEIWHFISQISSYAICFAVVGLYWISYHAVINPIKKTTDITIWCSASLLFFITLTPFTFKLVDEYPTNDYVILFYNTVQILAGSILIFTWFYSVKNNFFEDGNDNDENTGGLSDNKNNSTAKNGNIKKLIIKVTYYRLSTIPSVFVLSTILLYFNHETVDELAKLLPALVIPISIVIRLKYRKHKNLFFQQL